MFIPTLFLVALAIWWFVARPANAAAREREQLLRREEERHREVEEQKRALAELETFHWQKQILSGDMLISVDVHFPAMRVAVGTAVGRLLRSDLPQHVVWKS